MTPQASTSVAASVADAELRNFAAALLGPSLAALLAGGWQPALLRAFMLYEQQMACVWDGREALAPTLQTLSVQPEAPPWPSLRFLSLLYSADESTHLALVNRLADAWPQAAAVRSAAPTSRLRVGYLSLRLGAHATMVLMGGIPPAQDHRRFELFAYGFLRPAARSTRPSCWFRASTRCVAFRPMPGRLQPSSPATGSTC